MKPPSLALLALASFASFAPAALAQKEPPPACVKWQGQTVATGFGYDHVVIIDNTCARPAACVVSTDVAPEPIRATVAAKERVQLVTFRGSPSYAFTPRVVCKLQ